jgi:hypothetical protein
MLTEQEEQKLVKFAIDLGMSEEQGIKIKDLWIEWRNKHGEQIGLFEEIKEWMDKQTPSSKETMMIGYLLGMLICGLCMKNLDCVEHPYY